MPWGYPFLHLAIKSTRALRFEVLPLSSLSPSFLSALACFGLRSISDGETMYFFSFKQQNTNLLAGALIPCHYKAYTLYCNHMNEPLIGLTPLNDCVLVELQQSHKNFTTKEGKYDSRTEGIVVATPTSKANVFYKGKPMNTEGIDFLLDKRIHFEEFKEGARIKRNGKIYSFIKIEDIRGYEVE
jgi:co-chaperonin GroES (HSP10)